ncbi:MAG TPA: PepSY-associated TM helix domain-containing protein, partial [Sphingomicrobium sp.]
KVFSQFESRPAPSAPGREQAARARPLEQPGLTVDAAVVAAQAHSTSDLVSIAWPTDQKAEWKVGFARKGGNAIVPVDDRTASATPAPPPQPETLARTMRRWHDGTGMGLAWQIVIFVGGIIPALLSVTGIIIWWRARKPRQKARDYQRLMAEAA